MSALAEAEVQFTIRDIATGEVTCGECGAKVEDGQETCSCGACFVGTLSGSSPR
jgi:hypothetical protein